MKKTLEIDGKIYSELTGKNIVDSNRYIVVVDKGWLFAGDLSEFDNRIYLKNVVWIFKWESIGFNGVVENPKHENCHLRKMDNVVEIPKMSEIFRVPVCEDWGL